MHWELLALLKPLQLELVRVCVSHSNKIICIITEALQVIRIMR